MGKENGKMSTPSGQPEVEADGGRKEGKKETLS